MGSLKFTVSEPAPPDLTETNLTNNSQEDNALDCGN